MKDEINICISEVLDAVLLNVIIDCDTIIFKRAWVILW